MAKRTVTSFARSSGNKLVRSFNMSGGSPMTNLAGNALMVRGLFQFKNFTVAIYASLITGILNRLGGNFVNGICPIMPIFTKRFGD
jgi:hypothetical protein